MPKIIKSFAYAFNGLYGTFHSELSFRVEVFALLPVVAVGLYVGLSVLEWSLIIFAMGFVLVAELFNTAVERLGDEAAHGQHNGLVKKAKDVSAAAVLLSILTALVIGILFLIIPLVRQIVGLLRQ